MRVTSDRIIVNQEVFNEHPHFVFGLAVERIEKLCEIKGLDSTELRDVELVIRTASARRGPDGGLLAKDGKWVVELLAEAGEA